MPRFSEMTPYHPILHKHMFGYEIEFNILEILKVFETAMIDLHLQIVLIPEINDRDILKKSLTDLLNLKNVVSIGIVPVGLTKYRDNLTVLRKTTKEEAISLISEVEAMKNMRNVEHIYCADELYILAQMPIPDDFYYGDYDQIENGIGMVRKTLENWKQKKKRFIKYLNNLLGNPVFVTSVSGFYAIEPIIKDLQKSIKNKEIKTVVVKNHFFGVDVTVTGLLTWQDIKSQLKLADNDCLIFSSGIFNYEMRTIDDLHISDLKDELKKTIIVVDELFSQWVEY